MTIGIYKIENMIDHKIYIGQSKNIEQRWDEHKWSSQNINKGKEYEYPLYRAFRKYGIENFSFEIIEKCKIEELNNKERYWIKYYNSFKEGYNQTLGGDSSGYTLCKEKFYGIYSDLINTNLSQKEIAEKWGVHENTIQRINTGKRWYQDDVKDPIRKHLIHTKKINYCMDCGKEISDSAIRCKQCEYQRRILKCPITKEELKLKIRLYPFTTISRELDVSLEVLKEWLKNFKIPYLRDEINRLSDKEWEEI